MLNILNKKIALFSVTVFHKSAVSYEFIPLEKPITIGENWHFQTQNNLVSASNQKLSFREGNSEKSK